VIRLPEELLVQIQTHAERDYPHECCGALLGHETTEDGAAVKSVVALHAADNRREADAAARRFLITADDYRRIEGAARAASLDVLGFYHSHPDHPAQPSDYDRDHALPGYAYVIVSVRGGRADETTTWVLDDDRSAFRSEPMSVPGRAASRRSR
jgi:proteasome lid subunit RPN8/RPN11